MQEYDGCAAACQDVALTPSHEAHSRRSLFAEKRSAVMPSVGGLTSGLPRFASFPGVSISWGASRDREVHSCTVNPVSVCYPDCSVQSTVGGQELCTTPYAMHSFSR